MKKFVILAALALSPYFLAQELVTKPVQSFQTEKYQSKKKAFIDNLISKMTLAEKIGQLNLPSSGDFTTGTAQSSDIGKKIEQGLVGGLFNIKGVDKIRDVQKVAVEKSRLKIPMIFGMDVIHGYETSFPIPLGLASSWDMNLIQRSAQIAAQESTADGINWTFSPMTDISRDPRWGRVSEGSGEDPYLGSKIATARINGFQGDSRADLAKVNTIVACAKHFAAYGFAESGRDYNTVDISNSKLYNTVLPPFKAATDAGVRTFMNSFNILNGIPATGNSFLQRDILKGKWKFDGFVVSDWASVREMITHGFAKDGAEATQKAVNAGSDMDMESHLYVEELVNLVKKGKVNEALIDDAVRRILRVKFELGLFDDPYRYCDEKREKATIGNKANNDGVLDMAKKSIVLLKNEKGLLPLKKSGQKIALIGALANDKNSPLGSWRIASDDNTAVSVLEGMQQYKDNQLAYEKGTDLTVGKTTFLDELVFNTTDTSGFEAAKKVASDADVVIMVLGEHGFQSGEARSRTNLDLPGNQQELLEAIYKVNPNIVLVLNNGRPLSIPWAATHIPSIVEAWHLGTQTGNAVAQVLYGDYNPSGKLPMSFPRNVGQCPIYYNNYSTGRPTNVDKNVFWSHFSDVEKTPQFPFGFGLSYTTFEYKNLKIDKAAFAKGEPVQVSVDITNSGNYDGKEVAQLYIQDVAASLARPVKELKGFELINLKKGETKTVTFILTDKELGFFDNDGNYLVEAGTFKIMVGGSSDKGLESSFELQ